MITGNLILEAVVIWIVCKTLDAFVRFIWDLGKEVQKSTEPVPGSDAFQQQEKNAKIFEENAHKLREEMAHKLRLELEKKERSDKEKLERLEKETAAQTKKKKEADLKQYARQVEQTQTPYDWSWASVDPSKSKEQPSIDDIRNAKAVIIHKQKTINKTKTRNKLFQEQQDSPSELNRRLEKLRVKLKDNDAKFNTDRENPIQGD